MNELEQQESLAKPSLESQVPEVAQPLPTAPEDIVASFFHKNKIKLENQLHGLSAKQLRRMILFACAYPLIEPQKSNLSEAEKTTAYTLSEMVDNKAWMRLFMENGALAKAQDELKKQELEEANNNKGESSNGEE